jgi:hypothetical protein
MKTFLTIAALALATLTTGAYAADAACEAKALDKNGKALAGAAKNSFMKKCEAESMATGAGTACEAKALDKNGKALAGAAKNSFVKKCVADAAK